MEIQHIPLDQLSVSKANMRRGRKPPDISDILPSIIRRGVLSPLFVRPNGEADRFEIVAGRRRYLASLEAAKQQQEPPPLPCIVIGEADDAEALEVSMIENLLRQEPDPVTQWESFTRLVREGRDIEDIAATFARSSLQVRRILALGNLLPRIREAFRAEDIDAATVRQLTLASKAQQKAWLALFEDPEAYAPRGSQLKEWLFGGCAIATTVALFDLASYEGLIVTDLFEEQGYFADSDAFWAAQYAEIDARKAAYLEQGWSSVEIVPPGQYFQSWDYEKTPKRKGGRVYIDVNPRGEVAFHEGYLTRKEASRIRHGDGGSGAEGGLVQPAPKRPELTAPLGSYIDLHRHAAVRAELARHPSLALRVMAGHAICGSPLWSIRIADQRDRGEATRASIATCPAETAFDARRRAILALLGLDPENTSVAQSRYGSGLVPLFAKLQQLSDAEVLDVVALVMAETLAVGGELIEMLGQALELDMARYWQADEAFFSLLRDREVLTAILAEVGGGDVAKANAGEKGKVVKGVIADCLTGANDRPRVEAWVPRWMAFPPSAYTQRGGVGTLAAAERAKWLLEDAMADDEAGDEPKVGEAACTNDCDMPDEADLVPWE